MKFVIFTIITFLLSNVFLATDKVSYMVNRGLKNPKNQRYAEVSAISPSQINNFSQSQSMVKTKISNQVDILNPEIDLNGKTWTSGGIIGYEQCLFRGKSVIWKENQANDWYNFTILEGRAKQINVAGKRAPVKSFEVPKGFKLEYKGMLITDKYEKPLTEQQKENISNFQEKSFSKNVISYTDETCTYSIPYWYMSMRVTALEYVKISRRIPYFLKVGMGCQKLHIEKEKIRLNNEAIKYSCQSKIEELNTLEKSTNEYQNNLEELKSKKVNIQRELDYISQISIGNISDNEIKIKLKEYEEEKKIRVDSELRKMKEEVTKIIKLNSELEPSLNKLKGENSKILVKLHMNKNVIFKANSKISQLSNELITKEKKISEILIIVNEKHTELKNKKNEFKIKKEELRKLQISINDLEKQIQKDDDEYSNLITSMNPIKDGIDYLSQIKKNYENIYSKNEMLNIQLEKRISANDLEIKKKNELIQGFKLKLGYFTNEIQKLKDIQKLNTNFSEYDYNLYEEKKKNYQKEILDITTKVTSLDEKLKELMNKKILILTNIKTNENCMLKNSSELIRLENKIQQQMKILNEEYNAIISIFKGQSEYLSSIMRSFQNKTSLETWTLNAKKIISQYLELVPANLEPIFEMERRRRRYRRFLKRFF
jgi:chromosome segregation ATPase